MTLTERDCYEFVQKLLRMQTAQVCRHLIAVDFLGFMEQHGAKLDRAFLKAVFDAEDEIALALIEPLIHPPKPKRRPVRVLPILPQWFRDMAFGLSHFEKWRVLIDGQRFAVMQSPGGNYQSSRITTYGATDYLLVDKCCNPRNGHGVLHGSVSLKQGGRVGKSILANWKKLVEASDVAGTFVTVIGAK